MSLFPDQDLEVNRFYNILVNKGIKLWTEGDNLIASPSAKLTPTTKQLIAHYKPGLMALVEGRHVNGFKNSIAKGDNSVYHPFVDQVYLKSFYGVDFIKRTKSGDTPNQKQGSDVVVWFTSGNHITIDEKYRYRTNFSDIALEYMSSDRRKTPGWMEKDLSIDYLCYAFVLIKRAYIFPWQPLKVAWERNKADWIPKAESKKGGFFKVISPNEFYNTWSCAVPTDLLIERVKGAMVCQL